MSIWGPVPKVRIYNTKQLVTLKTEDFTTIRLLSRVIENIPKPDLIKIQLSINRLNPINTKGEWTSIFRMGIFFNMPFRNILKLLSTFPSIFLASLSTFAFLLLTFLFLLHFPIRLFNSFYNCI
jgi:hypothetical protein